MEEKRLSFLLMGKTGQGKSLTGNFILNRKIFKTSFDTTSKTKDVEDAYAELGQYAIKVVDGPGLEDTDIDKAKDKETAATNMNIALARCNGNIDAFLLVIKFGNRFTGEDKNALKALTRIFGDTYFNHVIIIMTGGDLFENAMEDETGGDKSFHGWCRKQTGEFKQLYADCGNRIFLFNNREKDEKMKQAKRDQLLKSVEDLVARHGRYTSASFLKAKASRDKLIVEEKAAILTEQIQEKVSLLNADIENLLKQYTEIKKEKIKKRIQQLKVEIKVQDKDTGVLKNLIMLVVKVEENLDDVDKLNSLNEELESIRKAKFWWRHLGSGFTGASGAAAGAAVGVALTGASVVAAPIVAVASGAAAVILGVATGISSLILHLKEKQVEKEQEDVKNRLKKSGLDGGKIN